MTHLDVGTLSLVAGALIPLVTGFLTKFKASDGVKALMTLTLSAIAGLVQVAINANGTVNVHTWLATGAATWFLAIVAHYGLWKPTGISGAVQQASANFGIGPATVDDVANAVPHPAVLEDLATRLGVAVVLPPSAPVTPPVAGTPDTIMVTNTDPPPIVNINSSAVPNADPGGSAS